jgi:hypothetical protein
MPRLVTSFAYELPFGRGKSMLNNAPKVANLLVSGWQANGVLTFGTGTPLIITGASVNTQGALFTGTQRPNSTGVSAKLSDPSISG